jgi:hypothetical protein
MMTLDTTSLSGLQDLSLDDQASLDGGGVSSGDLINTGLAMVGVGLAVVAGPVGAFGVGVALTMSAFGGASIGSGLYLALSK